MLNRPDKLNSFTAEMWDELRTLGQELVANPGDLRALIVIGYLYARLRELGWGRWTIILSTAVFRGSYHLYQGFGGFAGEGRPPQPPNAGRSQTGGAPGVEGVAGGG